MFLTYTVYLSLIICLAGIFFRLRRWVVAEVGPEAQNFTRRARLAGACRALGSVFRHPSRLGMLLRVLVLDVCLQRPILRQSRYRWLMHICLSYGILLLLLIHVFDDQITAKVFKNYASTLDPFQWMRHLLGVLVLLGIVLAAIRRRYGRMLRRTAARADYRILVLLAAIVISGAFLEAGRILSPTLFNEMVRDYMGSDDPAEVAPLKVYWAAEFQVAFTPEVNSEAIPEIKPEIKIDDPSLFNQGRMLHMDFCADCHSRPASAFLAYPLARGLKPMAAVLDRLRADLWLTYVHILVSCLALAFLPFSKLFHLLTTPLSLAVDAGGRAVSDQPVNRATRRAMGLDACTHCGVCSEHCAVAPIEQVLGNAAILPSEKLTALARKAAGRQNLDQQATLSEGSFICTDCGRCTSWCPSRIDLQDLWQAGRQDLTREGFSQPHGWIRQRTAAQWAQTLEKEPKAKPGQADMRQPLVSLSSKADTFWACVQCTTCTNVCPVVAVSEDPQRDLDLTPQQVMNLMRLRLKELALGSRMVWDCVSCYKCQEHCPQGVRVADVLYELRNEACRRFKVPAVVGGEDRPHGGFVS